MKTLIVARHGNTFEDGETPRRVGCRTDLPLTEKGREQARAIGRWLARENLKPSAVFSSRLRRTIETARLAAEGVEPQQDSFFNEVDYGPDENRTDADVIARIGADALKAWDENAIAPPGWVIDTEAIIAGWKDFGARLDGTVLAVTSNGIARFAPYLTGDFESFRTRHSLKIATGAVSILHFADGAWTVSAWNIKP